MGLFARYWPTCGSLAASGGLLLSTIVIASSGAAGQVASPRTSPLVGTYDGHQMEMAVGLRLRPNGRFDYALSYGALDESATGIWSVDGGQVILTSDPITAPRFVFVDERPAPDGKMRLALDLPKGWSRQMFSVQIVLADGSAVDRQLSDDDDVIAIDLHDRPVSLRLGLEVYDLRSDAIRLTGAPAYDIHARFEVNDLGKVAFAKTPLRIDGGNLTFERYGRSIVFRRVTTSTETK